MRPPSYAKKYPRTPHLPWSPGWSDDDIFHSSASLQFEHHEVVITEKMDGENTTMYDTYIHARSLDSRHHDSRSWVKNLHHSIKHLIPKGWRICGENLYAKHALHYTNLTSYFMVFAIFDDHDTMLSFEDTLEWCELLSLDHVPVLYRGPWDTALVRNINVDTNTSEGYVVRLASAFSCEDFSTSVAKWVRKGHVQADQTHWMYSEITPNILSEH